MSAKEVGKSILMAVVMLIIYVIFAIVYFIILSFVIKAGLDIVGAAGEVSKDALAIATAVLTAGTMIAGNKISVDLN